MNINEENVPLVALHPPMRYRARLYILTIIIGIVILGALIGATATFWMWRRELVEQQKNNNNNCTIAPSPAQTPTSTPVANAPSYQPPIAAPASVGLNQTFSSRMKVEEIMTTLQVLQDIADANNGTRFAGSRGYNETGQWIIDTLNSYGYFKVVRQDFTVPGQTTSVGTFNIIADTLAGPASPVVVVGAHLDSVSAGPGINDNGSGSATLLALARIVAETKMFNQESPSQLRLVWWGAEELGMLGSYHYVNDLKRNHPNQLAQIALNINLDTLGSPNFFRGIHNGSTAPEDVRHGSVLIQELFEDHFQSQGLPFLSTKFTYRSDYAAFIDRGIPVGGVFTGAEAKKSMKLRKIFGGLANTAFDPCYHQACDTIDNVNPLVLGEMAQAVAEVTAIVLFNPSILTEINPNVVKDTHAVKNPKI